MKKKLHLPTINKSEKTGRTDDRLIESGIKLFGELGYDAVSVRDIVKDSGANLSAVSYHFGGKSGMYKAVVEHLVNEVRLQLSELNAEQFATLSLPAMEQRLPEIILGFRELFISANGQARLNIFVRETASPDKHLSHQFLSNMLNMVRNFFQQVLIAYYIKRNEPTDKVNFVISLLFAMLKNHTQQSCLPEISEGEREDTLKRLISLIVTSHL